jgi:uncharacterized membrane protein YdjX (TVP38/TMEM64 family)
LRQKGYVERALGARWLRLALALGGVALLAVAVRLRFGHLLEPGAAAATLEQVRASPFAVPGFLAAYGVLVTLFAPAAALHLAAGAVWGFGWGLVLNLVAFNATASLQLLAVRALATRGGPVREGGPVAGEGRLGGLLGVLGAGRVAAIERRLARDGVHAAMLVRLLPLPSMAVSVAAALSPLRWRDFAIGTFVGTLPLTTVHTAMAAALVRGAEGARAEALGWLLLGGAMVLVLVVVSRRLARRAGGEGQEAGDGRG